MVKYKDTNDETHMTQQMKPNLTMRLVKISAYGVGSQIGGVANMILYPTLLVLALPPSWP